MVFKALRHLLIIKNGSKTGQNLAKVFRVVRRLCYFRVPQPYPHPDHDIGRQPLVFSITLAYAEPEQLRESDQRERPFTGLLFYAPSTFRDQYAATRIFVQFQARTSLRFLVEHGQPRASGTPRSGGIPNQPTP